MKWRTGAQLAVVLELAVILALLLGVLAVAAALGVACRATVEAERYELSCSKQPLQRLGSILTLGRLPFPQALGKPSSEQGCGQLEGQ